MVLGKLQQTIPKIIGHRAQLLDPQWWTRVYGRNFLDTGAHCFTQSVVTCSGGVGADAERLVVGKWRDVGVSEMWRRIQRLGINRTSTE